MKSTHKMTCGLEFFYFQSLFIFGIDLFARGHSPSSALNTHKLNLQVEYGAEYFITAADRAICPDLQFCHR